MALETMYELLMNELGHIYHAENQLLKALPNMARAARTPVLRKAFDHHLARTEDQAARLEQVFDELGVAARGRRCKGMEGLLERGKDLIQEDGIDPVIDAGLIVAAQRVERYEIAAYSSIVTFADLLGECQVSALMRISLDEERGFDQELDRIATEGVHPMAVLAGAEEDAEE